MRATAGLFAVALGILWPLAVLAGDGEPVFQRMLTLPTADDVIGYPRGVTTDLVSGEIFVCDSRGNRILIFGEDALLSWEIFGGDMFSAPRDLAVDSEGFLLVLANHDGRQAILELDFDGRFLREVVLVGEQPTRTEPVYSSIAVSPGGDHIYVVDSGNLVLWVADRDGEVSRAVDLAGGLSEDERTDLMLGKIDVYGDRILLAVPAYGEIRIFDLNGDSRGEIGDKGTGPCHLGFPVAAAVELDGNALIIDQQRMIIVRWDVASDKCLGEYYGIGSAPGYLYFPMDISLDRTGRLFVAQGFEGRVQAYDGFGPALGPSSRNP